MHESSLRFVRLMANFLEVSFPYSADMIVIFNFLLFYHLHCATELLLVYVGYFEKGIKVDYQVFDLNHSTNKIQRLQNVSSNPCD